MKSILKDKNDELSELLADFYNLVGIKICVYDAQGREIGYYPDRFTPFCALLRRDRVMERRCDGCDRHAVEYCRNTGEGYIYSCHAGLTECIAPILVGGEISGFVAIGQIREKGQPFHIDHPVSVDFAKLKALYEEMTVIARDKIVSALHIVQACASYEQFKKFLYETTNSFAVRFKQYVAEHLSEKLDVERLMGEFRLSRTEFYHSVEWAFGIPPAEYIKEQRLQFAYRMATESNLPVNQIAEQCGVGDYNYFSKLFKRRFGLTVRALRGRTGQE